MTLFDTIRWILQLPVVVIRAARLVWKCYEAFKEFSLQRTLISNHVRRIQMLTAHRYHYRLSQLD